ncbi:MAG: hypothetical protein KDM81_19085 [Verrucomicrobiae bacterium]|nr:hypothetical protein [Verrucomicrobiae bacterium]MCP5519021.1 hypothetical protein [Verrucomicrobiales bacterium]MCP5525573.1 hypothetical protein [Verrucomicrobiales bacterium]
MVKTLDANRSAEGQGTLVAQFGEARLVRRLNGAISLRGGSLDDRAEAHAWIVRFLRDAYHAEKAGQPEPRKAA